MNQNPRYAALLPLSISCVLALCGAGFADDAGASNDASKPFVFHENQVLGTSLDLQVVAPTQADADKAHAAVMEEIERLRQVLSTYDATSDLGRVNAARNPVKVSPEVIDLLKQYDQWQVNSKGAFSGRIGSLVAFWKQAAKTGAMPSKDQIATIAAKLREPLWKIDDAAGTVQRLGDGTINIDSLGKGFVVTRAADHARQVVPAVRGLLLNVGGDIAALGSSSMTGIEDWKVDIADPAQPAENAEPLTTVKLAGMSIATSGSYARGYAFGDLKLSHILDPRSGYPINSPDLPGYSSVYVASSTVIARDNGVANALASTLSVLSPQEGLGLIAATPGAEALVVLSNGKQLRSPGFSRYETVSDAVAGKGWAKDSQVSFSLQYTVNGRERPYIAVWVENTKGEHVTTIAEWGNGRWVNSLSTWYRFTRQDSTLQREVSRATRPAGTYTFVWDGKDRRGNPVPAGIYRICLEMSYERSGHSVTSSTIVCGEKASSSVLAATRHFNDIPVVFGPKGI